MVQAMTVSRNDPCPCGSGKKYKRCCGIDKRGGSAAVSTDLKQLIDKGLADLHGGQLAEAEICFKRALSAAPGDGGVYDLLGVVELHRKRFKEAARYFNQAIARSPSEPEFYNHLAHAMRGLKRLDDSITALKKAVTLAPDFAAGYHNLGNAYEELNQLDAAIEAYEMASTLSPGDKGTRYELAKVLICRGRYADAEKLLRRLLLEDANNADYWLQLGMVQEALRQLVDAESTYREAIARDPLSESAYVKLGAMLVGEGRFREAQTVVEARQRTGHPVLFIDTLS